MQSIRFLLLISQVVGRGGGRLNLQAEKRPPTATQRISAVLNTQSW